MLLVEVVRTKATLGDAERSVMESALRQQFALTDEELQALLDQATTTSRTAYDYQHFTSQLNEHFTQAEKIRLVEAMWQVAYADARPDENEMHTISKVAGLLHVTHGEYIGAKMRAKEVSPPLSRFAPSPRGGGRRPRGGAALARRQLACAARALRVRLCSTSTPATSATRTACAPPSHPAPAACQ